MSIDKSEDNLLECVSYGDRAAMKTVYDRYSEPICGFVTNWLADPSEAADIMHETMLEVWRSADRFSGRSSVKTWIFAIARNKAIDRNRKGARVTVQNADPDISDDAPDPHAVTVAFQDAKKVRACIEKLSPAHRSVIHLAFFEDLTYREIAVAEGTPIGTIKTRMMHAKALLMRCLSGNKD